VAAISKSILRKVLAQAQEKGRLPEVSGRLQDRASAKGGYKSRFLALNILVDYIEPFKFIEENPSMIKEVM
jgi:hypothetical protein